MVFCDSSIMTLGTVIARNLYPIWGNDHGIGVLIVHSSKVRQWEFKQIIIILKPQTNYSPPSGIIFETYLRVR